MSRKIKTNQKHMNQDSRVIIEKGLDASKPLSTIAAELGKDPTTVAKGNVDIAINVTTFKKFLSFFTAVFYESVGGVL